VRTLITTVLILLAAPVPVFAHGSRDRVESIRCRHHAGQVRTRCKLGAKDSRETNECEARFREAVRMCGGAVVL